MIKNLSYSFDVKKGKKINEATRHVKSNLNETSSPWPISNTAHNNNKKNASMTAWFTTIYTRK